MTSLNVWFAGARARTWPAAIVPVAVGTAAAENDLDFVRATLALLVALSLQIGVNYANDYSDGIRGTDDQRIGPARLVASGAATASAVKWAALGAFLCAAIAGTYLALITTGWLLLVGALCIGAAWCYTGGPNPYGYKGWGELSVFIFFGFVATAGTTYLQDERITALALGASVPVGLLTVALLITNNLRDLPGDKAAGKLTLAVRIGDRSTRVLYIAVVAMAFLCLAYLSLLRPWVLITFLVSPLAYGPIRSMVNGDEGQSLIPVLGATGKLEMFYGAFLVVGLLLK